jgi:hypothetical protein
MFHAKYFSSSSYGFLKEDILSVFFRLPWQPQFCLELNSLNNLIVDYKRNIPMKFGSNWLSGLWGDVI